MKFDVIITTYNREESLEKLVNQILNCKLLPENIIVVDSSDKINESIQKISKVKYIRSSHGNQPYQRYLGYLVAESDILVFLDDDMRVVENNCFNVIIEEFNKSDVVGANINFFHENYFLHNCLPKSKFKNKNNFFYNFIRFLIGNRNVEEGKVWLVGKRGKIINKREVEYFSGGSFAVRKKYLFKNFNFRLFDIFEKKLGMGEDTIIGYTLSKFGKIRFVPKKLFYHEDTYKSNYSDDFISYAKRVAYSRLFLSYEYIRINKGSYLIAYIHYNWYILWKIILLFLNFRKSENRKLSHGYLIGWYKAIKDNKFLKTIDNGEFWKKEAEKDLKCM